MLTELFPRAHHRLPSPPVLGAVVDGFAVWLVDQGYSRYSVRQLVRSTRRIDRTLQRRGVARLSQITVGDLEAHALADSPRDAAFAAAVRCLSRYCEVRGLLAP